MAQSKSSRLFFLPKHFSVCVCTCAHALHVCERIYGQRCFALLIFAIQISVIQHIVTEFIM